MLKYEYDVIMKEIDCMLILNDLEDEKDESVKRRLGKYGMSKAIKIVRIDGNLTEQGLDKDMKDLMLAAIEEKPEIFQGYDLCLHAITDEDTDKLVLYIGTFNPL